MPELITFFEAQKHYSKENMNSQNLGEVEKNSDILGVVEASNNLVTSNIVNLFIIQTIGIILVYFI